MSTPTPMSASISEEQFAKAIRSFFWDPEKWHRPISFERYMDELPHFMETVWKEYGYDPETAEYVCKAYVAITTLYQENTSANYYRAFSAWKSAKPYLPWKVENDLAMRMTTFYVTWRPIHEPAFELVSYLSDRAFTDDLVSEYAYMDEAKMAILFTKKPFTDEVRRTRMPEEELKELFLSAFRSMSFSIRPVELTERQKQYL